MPGKTFAVFIILPYIMTTFWHYLFLLRRSFVILSAVAGKSQCQTIMEPAK